jgi:hypothetical protein
MSLAAFLKVRRPTIPAFPALAIRLSVFVVVIYVICSVDEDQIALPKMVLLPLIPRVFKPPEANSLPPTASASDHRPFQVADLEGVGKEVEAMHDGTVPAVYQSVSEGMAS